MWRSTVLWRLQKDTIDASHLPYQPTKYLSHIWIVSSRFWDRDTQLGVAQRPEGTDPSSANPDDERQSHRTCMLQHSFRWDEDPGANDVPLRDKS